MRPYYQNDRVTLYHGDALGLLLELPDASVDAVITDPPYSSGGQSKGSRSGATQRKYGKAGTGLANLPDFGGDNRDQRSYQYWCTLWLGQCLRVTKPGGLLMQFTDWRQLPATTDAVQAGGWVWRGVIPWIKPQVRPMLDRFTANAEYVVWATHGDREIDYKGGGRMHLGYFFCQTSRERDHQTQKPMDVMRHLLEIVPSDGVVLDPFMGSGTTGAAAVNGGRRFIGVEHSAEYVGIAERRIRTAAGHPVASASQGALDFGEETA